MSAVRHYPGGPDDRALAALIRYRESTGREPPVRLTVVCAAGHALARVVQSHEGSVVIGRYTSTTLYSNEAGKWPPFVPRHGRPRRTAVAVLLEPLLDNQVIIVQCLCRTDGTAEIRAEWLRAQLDGGLRRAVYTRSS
jgi:hypothetical protein